MKFSTVKKYRKRHKILGSLLLKNPVLVMGLDLPFLVATSTSLRGATAVAIEMLCVHVVTMMVSMLTCRKLPLWIRIMVNMAVSTVTMMAARLLIFRMFHGISNSLGMYLYLIAVNGMTMLQAAETDRHAKIWPVFSGALLNVLGFSFVVAVVSVIREVLGNGTLWGNPLPIPYRFSGILIPFGGFIVMAFVLAAAKLINKKLLAFAMGETARKDSRYLKFGRPPEKYM